VRPSMRALATNNSQYGFVSHGHNHVPLLRSKNDKRYRIDTAGRSLRSSFRSSLFSFIALVLISTSESLVLDAAGGACFSCLEAMVAVAVFQDISGKRLKKVRLSRGSARHRFKDTHRALDYSSNDARTWLSNLSPP
jgi:hypothetical protein